MNEQHFMLTVYSNFYKGYSVHAESDFTITRLYLTLGVDTHPRLFWMKFQITKLQIR